MTKLERFIFKKHIYKGAYFKVLDNDRILWFSSLWNYLINRRSPVLTFMYPQNLTELEEERDKHC